MSSTLEEKYAEHVEDKVNVEEASVNLGHVKEEQEETEFHFNENQYKLTLTFENLFGRSSREQMDNRDSLIGFLDDEVIMEMGTIKLDVKNEEDLIRQIMEQSDCNKCGGIYEGYCQDCSSLSHILNNRTPNINSDTILNTVPLNILEIREVSTRQAVFVLKTLPKGVIIGPFEGVAPIESTNHHEWKIKDRKFVNAENGNWMKYIESIPIPSLTNLNVCQIDGILYYETCREIQEGEELLVCYREEEGVLESDEEEFSLIPVTKEKCSKVFACTLCCLGFGLESCLVEHKSKCPQEDEGGSIEDFEITQCHYCKVWLEKQEYLESHMPQCLQGSNRTRCETDGNYEKSTSIDGSTRDLNEYEIIKSKRSCKSRGRKHSKKHHDVKLFECGTCEKKYRDKYHLKAHIENQHLNTSEKKYKCAECSYQTNHKGNLRKHLNTHFNTNEEEYKCHQCSYQSNYKSSLKTHIENQHLNIKAYQCDICEKKFTGKTNLKTHIEKQHLNTEKFNHIKYQHYSTEEKDYKCTECPFQTNDKFILKRHSIVHSGVKRFHCDICNKKFSQVGSLNRHMTKQHSNTEEKKYKCSECSFQTKYEYALKRHSIKHSGIKPFECNNCKKKFVRKDILFLHIKNEHRNICEKECECPKCSNRTNLTSSRDTRSIQHSEKKYSDKRNNRHSNTNEKKYKCTECSYRTNYATDLKRHTMAHNGIKPFECYNCKSKFSHKSNLKTHIKSRH